MADNKIPLFRIPFLALCIILDDYSFYDMIQLSLCSKRSLRVARNCWKKKGLVKAFLCVKNIPSVRICYYHNNQSYSIFISKARDLRDEQTENVSVGDAVVPSVHENRLTLITYWDDKIFGIEQVVRYIKDLFDVTIHSIDLNTEEYPNEFIDTMDCIMKVQESVQYCTMDTLGPIDGCLTHLLDNCRITRRLMICREPTSLFKHDWNIHFDDLYLLNGSSFTFQNLMNINCKSLELCCSSLTSEDANQFLKHWQKGGNPCLKFLYMEIEPIDQETVTSGIDTILQPQVLQRYYQSASGSKTRKFGGLDIQRNDGTTGTIFTHYNTFEFGVDPEVISLVMSS